MASPSNYSVGYNFEPDDVVWVIHENTSKRGTVRRVDVDITSSGTTITYWIQLDGELNVRSFDEDVVYGTCREAPGYQDIEFDSIVLSTDTVFNTPILGTPTAVIKIDGTPFVLISTLTTASTLQDVVDEINTTIGAAGTAEIITTTRTVIRVTSATKGTSSTVRISDDTVVLGSPLTLSTVAGSPVGSPLLVGSPLVGGFFYFDQMTEFTGIAAPYDGLEPGAIEALNDLLCER